jgi:hypothetical protein
LTEVNAGGSGFGNGNGQRDSATSAMPVTNAEIAAQLEKIADLLDIEGANQFRIRAYRRAARVVGELP